MAGFEFNREVAARLGNNLDAAFHKPLPLPIRFKNIERHIRQYTMNAFDSLDDVRQAGNERTCGH
jgi:hypothetical protein